MNASNPEAQTTYLQRWKKFKYYIMAYLFIISYKISYSLCKVICIQMVQFADSGEGLNEVFI